jgi:4-amino-4-deoxy-L-arabinose transferase-like glycosyltransferase
MAHIYAHPSVSVKGLSDGPPLEPALARRSALLRQSTHSHRAILLSFLLYLYALSIVAWYRPLWLDELLQLQAARGASLIEVLRNLSRFPAGVPVAYLLEHIVQNIGGSSSLVIRAPSIAAGVLTVVLLRLLTNALTSYRSPLPYMLFALLPLQIRYATEARPYELALAASLASTLLLHRLYKRITVGRIILYVASSTICLYTQPYAFFVCVAHVVWVCLPVNWNRRTLMLTVAGGALLSSALFLPWYLYAHTTWVEVVHEAAYGSVSWKTPFLLIREITGSGYLLSVPFLALAIIGYRSSTLSRENRRLLLCCAIIPAILALLADAFFGYFVAIRQMLFILPPLCIFSAEGVSVIAQKNGMLARASSSALLAGFCFSAVRFATSQSENWKAAATVGEQLLRPGGCIQFVPPNSQTLFQLVSPGLQELSCGKDRTLSLSIALISPYATRADREAFFHGTSGPLAKKARKMAVGKSEVLVLP